MTEDDDTVLLDEDFNFASRPYVRLGGWGRVISLPTSEVRL